MIEERKPKEKRREGRRKKKRKKRKTGGLYTKGFRKKFIDRLQKQQKDFPNAEDGFANLNKLKAKVQEKKERRAKERSREL